MQMQMSIKLRLRLSYVAMLIIPIVLIGFAGWIMKEVVGLEGNNHAFRERNPVLKSINLSQKVLGMVNVPILENPDKLAESDFVEKLEKNIGIRGVGLIVRKNQDIVYVPKFLEDKKNEIKLIPFKSIVGDEENILNKKEDIVLARLYDFYFTDKNEGSIFLVFSTEEYIKDIQEIQYFFVIFTAIILFMTNGVITLLLYKSIIKPLKELENASNAVKNGDLNYKIQNCFKDEFGDAITSFEEMQKRLRHSLELQLQYEESRKLLISNIAHDLKTPITSIQGYIEGIRDGVADTPEKMEKYTDTIYKKASDMNELIDDLFLFSKLDLNKLPFDFKELNIVEYLKDIGEELQFDLEKKGILLDVEYPSKKISVKGDANNLRRAIINIIDNSIKYVGHNQLKINISIEEQDEVVQIEIKDNGKGISKETLPFIFERFYRADPARNADTGGSGLGLAIVKKIIEEHGGNIWVESVLNKGTRIYFTLNKLSTGCDGYGKEA